MTVEGFLRLAAETVKDPQAVARLLIGISLPRETLWMALALMCILSTLAVSAANILVPPPVDLPAAMANPFLFAAFLIGGSVLTLHALVWTGRAAGGKGQMGDILILMVWLQALRAAVQAAQLPLILISPFLAGLLAVAASLLGIWITVGFIAAAHQFDTLLKAVGVLFMALLGIALGLAFLLSLIGVSSYGLT